MLKILVAEPGKQPKVIEIENELEVMQKLVGGWIEAKYLDNHTVLICNEEGKIRGLSPNRWCRDDFIVGTFFIAGDNNKGDFISLTNKQITKLSLEFRL